MKIPAMPSRRCDLHCSAGTGFNLGRRDDDAARALQAGAEQSERVDSNMGWSVRCASICEYISLPANLRLQRTERRDWTILASCSSVTFRPIRSA